MGAGAIGAAAGVGSLAIELFNTFKSDNPFQNISETRLRDFQKKFDNEKHLNKVQFRKYWSQEDEFSDEQISKHFLCLYNINKI